MGQYFFAVYGQTSSLNEDGVEFQSLGVAEAFVATLLASKVQPDGPNHVIMDAVIRDAQGTVLSCVSINVSTVRNYKPAASSGFAKGLYRP